MGDFWEKLLDTLEIHAPHEREEIARELDFLYQQLIDSEKMAIIGKLTAGIAHEINNPVNFISSTIDSLKMDLEELKRITQAYRSIDSQHSEEQLQKAHQLADQLNVELLVEEMEGLIEGIEEGARRTAAIVRGLKDFSRKGTTSYQEFDIHQGIDSTLILLKNKIKDRIVIHKVYADLPMIECLPEKINQVLMNILNNAIQAIDEKGNIHIHTCKEAGMIKVSVEDDGIGIKEEILNRIFEPFFTTKPLGIGTGLGLSISLEIVKNHMGTLEVESNYGKGTKFVLLLPVKQDKA